MGSRVLSPRTTALSSTASGSQRSPSVIASWQQNAHHFFPATSRDNVYGSVYLLAVVVVVGALILLSTSMQSEQQQQHVSEAVPAQASATVVPSRYSIVRGFFSSYSIPVSNPKTSKNEAKDLELKFHQRGFKLPSFLQTTILSGGDMLGAVLEDNEVEEKGVLEQQEGENYPTEGAAEGPHSIASQQRSTHFPSSFSSKELSHEGVNGSETHSGEWQLDSDKNISEAKTGEVQDVNREPQRSQSSASPPLQEEQLQARGRAEGDLNQPETSEPQALFQDDSSLVGKRPPLTPECDLWSGRWVWDKTYPLWEVGSCNFGLNNSGCTQLGREDTYFLHFRWQPDQCDLPRFNPAAIRERLRGKRLVVVGDSLARNHFQSLVCLLGSGIPHAHKVVQEISGAQRRNRLDWRVYEFKGHDFTLEYYLSHYLVMQHSLSQRNHPKEVRSVINTGAMDYAFNLLTTASKKLHLGKKQMLVVLNAGHWYNRAKTYDKGSYFSLDNGTTANTSLPLVDGFEAGMRTVAQWAQSMRTKNITVLWRSYSPVHFMGASWNRGGHCRNQWPTPGLVTSADHHASADYVDETADMAERAIRVMTEAMIPVIDIMPLSSLRPDGHPSRYFSKSKRGQDCSHWCLPGVPDTWNELMFAYLTSHQLL